MKRRRPPLVERETPETILLRRTAYAELREAVGRLPPFEAEVTRRRFGLDDGPQTYAEISEAIGRKKGAVAAAGLRALWHLQQIMKGPPEPLDARLTAEEVLDLQQIAHGEPPISWGQRVLTRLVTRGLITRGKKKWEVTERGAVTAQLTNEDPFKPYRCRCMGRWSACPLCGKTYHAHTTSAFWLPKRCLECNGALEAENEQGPHGRM